MAKKNITVYDSGGRYDLEYTEDGVRVSYFEFIRSAWEKTDVEIWDRAEADKWLDDNFFLSDRQVEMLRKYYAETNMTEHLESLNRQYEEQQKFLAL